MILHGDREKYQMNGRRQLLSLHIGKNSKDECNNRKRISLFSVPRKV